MSGEDTGVPSGLEGRLKVHVGFLAGEIGEKNVFTPGSLDRAAAYIRRSWEDAGYAVGVQRYAVEGTECENLSAAAAGGRDPREIIIIGAHYDTVPGSPGANDNCSAVAAMLEISRMMVEGAPGRTVRFVAFANEEPPFFGTDFMGSRVYARACRERGEEIVAMMSLETIGYYSDEKGSQEYPAPLGLFYPDRGNFLAVVGDLKSGPLVRSFAGFFSAGSGFPVQGVSTFSWLPGVDWSDHASFRAFGYPGIMVTDTAFYRYPYYHTPSDTPDKLDYPSLARVTYGIYKAVSRLAQG